MLRAVAPANRSSSSVFRASGSGVAAQAETDQGWVVGHAKTAVSGQGGSGYARTAFQSQLNRNLLMQQTRAG